MAEEPKDDPSSLQVSIRIPGDLFDRMSVLGITMGRSDDLRLVTDGMPMNRSEVIRAALRLGVEELERRFAPPPTTVPPGATG